MRLFPGLRQRESRESGSSPRVKVNRLYRREDILAYLEPRRGYAVTAFAHLEPSFPEVARWYLARHETGFALCLIARGLFPTYMFTLGDTALLDSLLDSIRLPGRTFFTCAPEHLEVLKRHYEMEWNLEMNRMIVTREAFTPSADEATRLRPPQVRELNHLYSLAYSSNFTSVQVRRGVFYGLWRDEQLVAVAGTHFVSPTYDIAYVGNVMTHPSYRNQGLATACVSSVTGELLQQCREVVLNVEAYNLPAVRTYTGLGYRDYCGVVEGVGHRRRLVGAIINSVLGRMGLTTKYEERMEPNGEIA